MTATERDRLIRQAEHGMPMQRRSELRRPLWQPEDDEDALAFSTLIRKEGTE